MRGVYANHNNTFTFYPDNHMSDDQPRLRCLTSANGTRASDKTCGGAVESLRLERKLEVRFSGAD